MTDSVFPPTIDTFAQPLATTLVAPAPSGADHAMLDRKAAQAIAELEALAQIDDWDYLIIQDSNTYATGTKVRNCRTAEQEFGPTAMHSAFSSVTAALAAKAVPGGRVGIVSRKADNTSIKTRDVLDTNDCPGLYIAAHGYAKNGQTAQGHPDAGVVIEAEKTQFPGGRKAVLDMTTGTGPLDLWTLDGVSIQANSEAECAVRAAALEGGLGSLFRLNLRGGTGATLRLGEKGWTGCGLVQAYHAQISHNDAGANSLVECLAGDLQAVYCNPATNSSGAYAILIDTDGNVLWAFSHDAGGGASVPGIKVVRGKHVTLSFTYHDNQEDHVNGAFWIKPASDSAIGLLELIHGRINCNDDGTGSPALVGLDGSSSGFGVPLIRIHGLFTKGNKLTGGTPALVPAVVKAFNGFDAGSVVVIEDCDVMDCTAVWITDGSTAWRPAWTKGNQISPSLASNGDVLEEQDLVVTFTGTSISIPHKLYGTPDYVRVKPIRSTPAAGRLSAEATASAVIVHSTASETSLKVHVFAKML